MALKKQFILQWMRFFRSKLCLSLILFTGALILVLAAQEIYYSILFTPLQNLVFYLEDSYQQWMNQQALENPVILFPLAFGGGLIASLSPCTLAMLPVNLSYIGTREIRSRWEAVAKAGLFVLGVMTTMCLLGLFSSLAGAVTVQYQGYVKVIVGMIIGIMGLTLLGMIRLPLPQTRFNLPITSPYSFGLTFALISSPCTSPVLLAILSTAAVTDSRLQSILTMSSYALGYTTIIFCTSLFAGIAKQTRKLLQYSEAILKFGGFLLLLVGIYHLINGIRWLVLIYTHSN